MAFILTYFGILYYDLGLHGGVVGSTVASQQEGRGFNSHTKAIKVEVFVNDDVEQRVSGRPLRRDLLPVSVDEGHRHLVVQPEKQTQ